MNWSFTETPRPSRSASSKVAHISTIFVHEGGLSRGGVAFACLSPIKKAKQPPPSFPSAPSARSFVRALVPACSYAPAPVPHPRVFGSPSAHDSRLCLFVRTSALAPSPRVLGSSRPRLAYGSFGSPQYPTFCRVPAPFRTLAISAPSSQLSFPLLRLPRARFLGPPFHIPRACAPRPFLRRLLYAPCSVRHAVPRTLFFSRRIFYMTSTVSWQLSGRSSREIRRALSYS